MRLLFFVAFVAVGAVPIILSWNTVEDASGVDQTRTVAALIVTEAVLAVIPLALMWQWYDLAYDEKHSEISGAERYYYKITVVLLGLCLLGLWYLFPYRLLMNWNHEEIIPAFTAPNESKQFLEDCKSWISDESNWPWFIFPVVLIALPYSRLVINTPPFARARGAAVYAAFQAAQRGLSHALYRLSAAIQSWVDRTIQSVRELALLLNRTLARVVESGVMFVLNLTDVFFRVTALIAILSIGLVLLIPGLLTGNPALIGGGIFITALIMIGILSAITRPTE